MGVKDVGLFLDQDLLKRCAVVVDSEKLRQHQANAEVLAQLYRDLGVPESVPTNWGKRYKWLEKNSPEGKLAVDASGLRVRYSTPLNSAILVRRVQELATVARARGYQFFGPQYTSSPHNSKAAAGGYHLTATWSGFICMSSDAFNYYDSRMTIGADSDVHFRIIHERQSLGVLQDPCLCVQMDFGAKKYKKRGLHYEARMEDYTEIVGRYPKVCKIAKSKSYRSSVEHLKYTGVYGK
jgi:hypothetical protein